MVVVPELAVESRDLDRLAAAGGTDRGKTAVEAAEKDRVVRRPGGATRAARHRRNAYRWAAVDGYLEQLAAGPETYPGAVR